MTTSPRDVAHIATKLIAFGEKLAADPTAARRLRAWTLTANPAPGEPVSGGDPSNPTLAAILRPEPVHRHLKLLRHAHYPNPADMPFEAVLDLALELALVGHEILHELYQADLPPNHPNKPRLNTGRTPPTYCAEAQLDDHQNWIGRCKNAPAPGRRGRCEACYRWGQRWSDNHGGDWPPPPVPDDIYKRRTA